MRILIVSSSLDPRSRSEKVARRCLELLLDLGAEAVLLSLKEYPLPAFGSVRCQDVPAYHALHAAVLAADGLVLASPVYNWSSCAELKKFVEYVGSTDDTLRGAFYDKVVTFVHAAGLPHSYIAGMSLAVPLMLDFRCIINPYSVYVHNRHWEEERLLEEAEEKLLRAMTVMKELTLLLSQRTYVSEWGV
jgi:NAD(P)H-dependent FMN reductase